MTEALWAAIIGVGGTLLGIILGWLLNSLSSKGRLIITTVKTDASFQNNIYGGMIKCDIKEALYFSYKVEIDIYNTSGKTKFMRGIKFNFVDASGKILITIIPNDMDLRIIGKLEKNNFVQPINIIAHSVISKVLYFGVYKKNGNEFDFISNTEKVYLTYLNEKAKTKKILINKGNIKDYYKNDSKKTDNGQAGNDE